MNQVNILKDKILIKNEKFPVYFNNFLIRYTK